MTAQQFVSPNEIRARFSHAMSDMYQKEVPLYGDLLELVAET
ncbi:2-oxoadipate dioxygenase/decarboxylase family protein, partial [Serratia marcescens]